MGNSNVDKSEEIANGKEMVVFHRDSVTIYDTKAGTETVCLRIVYADMKKALARNSQVLDFQCGPAWA